MKPRLICSSAFFAMLIVFSFTFTDGFYPVGRSLSVRANDVAEQSPAIDSQGGQETSLHASGNFIELPASLANLLNLAREVDNTRLRQAADRLKEQFINSFAARYDLSSTQFLSDALTLLDGDEDTLTSDQKDLRDIVLYQLQSIEKTASSIVFFNEPVQNLDEFKYPFKFAYETLDFPVVEKKTKSQHIAEAVVPSADVPSATNKKDYINHGELLRVAPEISREQQTSDQGMVKSRLRRYLLGNIKELMKLKVGFQQENWNWRADLVSKLIESAAAVVGPPIDTMNGSATLSTTSTIVNEIAKWSSKAQSQARARSQTVLVDPSADTAYLSSGPGRWPEDANSPSPSSSADKSAGMPLKLVGDSMSTATTTTANIGSSSAREESMTSSADAAPGKNAEEVKVAVAGGAGAASAELRQAPSASLEEVKEDSVSEPQTTVWFRKLPPESVPVTVPAAVAPLISTADDALTAEEKRRKEKQKEEEYQKLLQHYKKATKGRWRASMDLIVSAKHYKLDPSIRRSLTVMPGDDGKNVEPNYALLIHSCLLMCLATYNLRLAELKTDWALDPATGEVVEKVMEAVTKAADVISAPTASLINSVLLNTTLGPLFAQQAAALSLNMNFTSSTVSLFNFNFTQLITSPQPQDTEKQREVDLKRAQSLAAAAIGNVFPIHRDFKTLNSDKACGVFLHDKRAKLAVFAFRGTKDPIDVLTDITFFSKEFVPRVDDPAVQQKMQQRQKQQNQKKPWTTQNPVDEKQENNEEDEGVQQEEEEEKQKVEIEEEAAVGNEAEDNLSAAPPAPRLSAGLRDLAAKLYADSKDRKDRGEDEEDDDDDNDGSDNVSNVKKRSKGSPTSSATEGSARGTTDVDDQARESDESEKTSSVTINFTGEIEDSLKMEVHTGFYGAFDSIRGQLDEIISTLPDGTKVLMVGHSMGGALAQIAAAYYADLQPWLVSFGAPSIGNQKFCDFVNDNVYPNGGLRVWNEYDSIPYVALLVGYQHAGIPIKTRLKKSAKDLFQSESVDALAAALDVVSPHILYQIGSLIHVFPVMGTDVGPKSDLQKLSNVPAVTSRVDKPSSQSADATSIPGSDLHVGTEGAVESGDAEVDAVPTIAMIRELQREYYEEKYAATDKKTSVSVGNVGRKPVTTGSTVSGSIGTGGSSLGAPPITPEMKEKFARDLEKRFSTSSNAGSGNDNSPPPPVPPVTTTTGVGTTTAVAASAGLNAPSVSSKAAETAAAKKRFSRPIPSVASAYASAAPTLEYEGVNMASSLPLLSRGFGVNSNVQETSQQQPVDGATSSTTSAAAPAGASTTNTRPSNSENDKDVDNAESSGSGAKPPPQPRVSVKIPSFRDISSYFPSGSKKKPSRPPSVDASKVSPETGRPYTFLPVFSAVPDGDTGGSSVGDEDTVYADDNEDLLVPSTYYDQFKNEKSSLRSILGDEDEGSNGSDNGAQAAASSGDESSKEAGKEEEEISKLKRMKSLAAKLNSGVKAAAGKTFNSTDGLDDSATSNDDPTPSTSPLLDSDSSGGSGSSGSDRHHQQKEDAAAAVKGSVADGTPQDSPLSSGLNNNMGGEKDSMGEEQEDKSPTRRAIRKVLGRLKRIKTAVKRVGKNAWHAVLSKLRVVVGDNDDDDSDGADDGDASAAAAIDYFDIDNTTLEEEDELLVLLGDE